MRMQRKATTRDYLATTTAQIGLLGLGLVSGVVLARFLGPEGRGQLALLLLFPMLAGTFLHFGVPQALARSMSSCDEMNSGSALLFGITFSAGMSLLASIVAIFVGKYVLNGISAFASIFAFCSFFYLLSPFVVTVMRVRGLYIQLSIMNVLFSLSALLVIIFLAVSGINEYEYFAVASILSTVLLCCIAPALLLRKSAATNGGLGSVKVVALMRSGFAQYVPHLSFAAFQSADRVLIGTQFDASSFGYYVVALSLAAPLFVLSDAISQVAFIDAAKSVSVEESLELETKFALTATLCMFVWGALALFSPFLIIFLFGEQFGEAAQIVWVVMLSYALMGLSRLLSSFLLGSGHTGPVFVAWAAPLPILALVFLDAFGATLFDICLLLVAMNSLTMLLLLIACEKKLSFRIRSLKRAWGLAFNRLLRDWS